MRYSKHGFTLIELIIVIVIIGILASIAAPMMGNMKKKAIVSEAIAALGTIRSAEMAYYAEFGSYRDVAQFPDPPRNFAAIGIQESDLETAYFSHWDYYVCQSAAGNWFFVCWPAPGRHPNSPVNNWIFTGHGVGYIGMDVKGNIYSDYDGLGYQRNAEMEGFLT